MIGAERMCPSDPSKNKKKTLASAFTNQPTVMAHRLAALLLRFGVIAFSVVQDRYFNVKFTDIDYVVYTDASRFMTKGGSPFERSTYRYSPLMALLTTVNIYGFMELGKIIFAVCDVIVGDLMQKVMVMRGVSAKRASNVVDFAWLFNPVVIVISCRGSADVLVALMMLGSVYFMLRDRVSLSAAIYGLAVHFRLYPVIFGPAFVLFLWDKKVQFEGRSIPTIVKDLLFSDGIKFFIVSASTCISITAFFYSLYGDEFIFEAYLYHYVRKDIKHNFSVYFYHLYLSFGQPTSAIMDAVLFLPQLLILAATVLAFHADMPLCLFVETFVFVLFNKVCTAQYFLWYLPFLVLIIPHSTMRRNEALGLVTGWILTTAHWLYWAHAFEFLGNNTFLQIWIAGILFFAMNSLVLVRIMLNHTCDAGCITDSPSDALSKLADDDSISSAANDSSDASTKKNS